MNNLRKGTSENNCKCCQHCRPFEVTFSEYVGRCDISFNAPIKPTTICDDYVFDDTEGERVLLKNW